MNSPAINRELDAVLADAIPDGQSYRTKMLEVFKKRIGSRMQRNKTVLQIGAVSYVTEMILGLGSGVKAIVIEQDPQTLIQYRMQFGLKYPSSRLLVAEFNLRKHLGTHPHNRFDAVVAADSLRDYAPDDRAAIIRGAHNVAMWGMSVIIADRIAVDDAALYQAAFDQRLAAIQALSGHDPELVARATAHFKAQELNKITEAELQESGKAAGFSKDRRRISVRAGMEAIFVANKLQR